MPVVREMPADCQPIHRAQHLGLRSLATHELIQLIYSFRNTETGELLVSKAPSLRELSNLSIEELQEVPGVGLNAAVAVKAALELGRRMAVETEAPKPMLNSPEAIANYASHLGYLEVEHLCVLLLDTKSRPIALETVHVGSVDSCQFAIGQLFKAAVRRNATSVVVLHNHPSGDPAPSDPDITATRQVIEAGRLMDIPVLDHIVIGRGGRFYSLRQHNRCAF